MKKSKDDDPETRKTENVQYKIELKIKFKANYDQYQNWEEIYKSKITKAYDLFWEDGFSNEGKNWSIIWFQFN
jgi:hypothetical protein